MADAQTRSYPRFNHVALTVPGESLGEEGRRALLGFYGDPKARDLTGAPRLPGDLGIDIRDAMTYDLETPD